MISSTSKQDDIEAQQQVTTNTGMAVNSTVAATTSSTERVNPDQLQSRRSSRSGESVEDDDRIRGWEDVMAAVRLTWSRQKKHLLITWLHVPIGVTFLLVISWGLRLAINEAPFRFPAPVIAMLIFFFGLLVLEWLSIKFPGQENEQSAVERGETVESKPSKRKQKRFVDPVMRLLAPPCEWCLRNMNVMFTPSFILIPARETIPGKEIGLLAAWFTASQVIAFVLPVFFNLAITKGLNAYSKRFGKEGKEAREEEKRRHSVSSVHASRRGSVATLSGVDYEKGVAFNGGPKLGAVATGLSGLTAHMIAPVTHVRVEIDDDVRRQIESTVLEYARQQGDPAVGAHRKRLDYKPVSDVSNFHHSHPHQHLLHMHRSPSAGGRSSRNRRGSRSRERDGAPSLQARTMSHDDGFAHKAKRRPDLRFTVSMDTNPTRLKKSSGSTVQAERSTSQFAARAPAREAEEADTDRPSRSTEVRPLQGLPVLPPTAHVSNDIATYRFPAVTSFDVPPTVQARSSESEEDEKSGQKTAVASRRPSSIGIDAVDEKRKIGWVLQPHPSHQSTISPSQEGSVKADSNDAANRGAHSSPSPQDEDEEEEEEEEEEETAVERLASWFADLITPTAYFILFIVGIPLFFRLDIALPLFLAINILCFLAAITIVPPKIRRFAHPILTTSFATVMIIWAFAAMKGISLKDCLNRFYSVGARYSVLWNPSGYQGPVPGAGDILFSTLDAGIIALAVPMYRYRKELWENLTRMLIVLVPCAGLSLFFWPYIARLIGMDPIRSLAFAARFMSTPLAIELASNVGADQSITVILVVITGVVAAIFKEQFFYRLMRVSKDDYLTVGLTMGSTSGAIGANSLLTTPRTMAIASLGFVIFGAILLIATAIPTIVDAVRTIAGA